MHSVRGCINESRSGSEDCVGVGGIILFGASLSFDHVCAARRLANGLQVARSKKAPSVRSLIAFTAWSSFAHAAVMGTQALRNMISRGELVGVAVLGVIGVTLIALAPAKQGARTRLTAIVVFMGVRLPISCRLPIRNTRMATRFDRAGGRIPPRVPQPAAVSVAARRNRVPEEYSSW